VTLRAWLRIGVAIVRILVVCVVLAAGATYAFLKMFAQFQAYDDEGQIMTSVATFLDGLPLYDRTFTQYGPFYYACMGLLYRLSRLPIGHDVTRIVTVVVWISTAALLGFFVVRATRSFGAGLLVYLQTVILADGLTGEPGHPQGLLLLMLAVLLVASTWRRAAVPIAVGAIVGCVLMTKINVGVFAAAAAALAFLALAPPTRVWRAALAVTAAAVTLLPFALMRASLSTWAGPYATLGACAIGASCVAAWRLRPTDAASKPVVRSAAAAAGVVLLLMAWTLLTGTSVRGLIEGVLLAPLRFASVYVVPWGLPPAAGWYGLAALAVAIAAAFIPRTSAVLPYASAAAKIAFVVLVGRSAMFDLPSLPLLAPWVWVVLLPVAAESSNWSGLLPRAMICFLAATHLLVAYPVAGNQQAWATLLLLPAAGLALADGLMLLPAFGAAFTRGAAEAALLVAAIYWYSPAYQTDQLRARYRIYASLDLPHAGMIRLPRAEKRVYRDIVSAVRADCDTFVTMPGLGSFYAWTEKPPLTGFNATAWMTLLDDRTQQKIVDALTPHRSACVIYHEGLTRAWAGARPIDDRPLVKYIRSAFHPVRTFGDYQLLMRNDR
jgi:hypothetical protein